jgi:hypothetical protein
MGMFLIVLSVVWFVMALVFVFALAAAGRRPCLSLDAQSHAFVPKTAVNNREDVPAFSFREQDTVPAT